MGFPVIEAKDIPQLSDYNEATAGMSMSCCRIWHWRVC